MAVTQVVEQDAAVAPSKAPRAARLPGAAWTSPSQFIRAVPFLSLLARISAVPQVSKIEILVDGAGLQVHVLMSNDNREARSAIFSAERDYLNSTRLHSFDLRVSEVRGIPDHILDGYRLAGFETVLER